MSIVPVCPSQKAKGEDEREEDDDEADVSAEGADHVDEAEDALDEKSMSAWHRNRMWEENWKKRGRRAYHPQAEEAKSSIEGLGC